MFPAMANLKCAPCTDRLITEGGSYPETKLPDAVTIVPRVLPSPLGMPITVQLPVCFPCRADELKDAPTSGLIQAQGALASGR